MSTPNPVSRCLTLLSALAVWPACYTLGVYLVATLALELETPSGSTVAFLLLIAHICYLLDRVKLSDSRQDPADAIALPQRALLFAERSRLLRMLLIAEAILASIVGWWISTILVLIPLGALFGVHLYAGRAASPGAPRLKDLPALKSFFISSAHIALVVAVLWGNDHNLIEHPRARVLLSIAGLWLVVSADAILCDIDDAQSDALYATLSLPVLLGKARSWALAIFMLLIGSGLLFSINVHDRAILICVIGLTLSAGATLNMKNRRDLIDARLLPIALFALLLR